MNKLVLLVAKPLSNRLDPLFILQRNSKMVTAQSKYLAVLLDIVFAHATWRTCRSYIKNVDCTPWPIETGEWGEGFSIHLSTNKHVVILRSLSRQRTIEQTFQQLLIAGSVRYIMNGKPLMNKPPIGVADVVCLHNQTTTSPSYMSSLMREPTQGSLLFRGRLKSATTWKQCRS